MAPEWTILAASLDARLSTMLRFFLIAAALVGPLALWRTVRRARNRAEAKETPEPLAATAVEPEVVDLAWLVHQIDAAASLIGPEQPDVEVEVPDDLIVQAWGDQTRPADPVASAIVVDALRRGRLTAHREHSGQSTVLRLTSARSDPED